MVSLVLDNVSFRGRARRLDYWIFCFLVPVALMIVATVAAMVMGRLGLVIAVVIGLVYAVAYVGLHVRRLHDREMSAHWLWVFWGLPFVLQAAGGVSSRPGIQVFCAVVTGLIGLWCLVELGFFRGTEGPNAYGDDPAR